MGKQSNELVIFKGGAQLPNLPSQSSLGTDSSGNFVSGGASGTAVLDFGAFPGSSDASVVVAGQANILSSSIPEAYIVPSPTADHSADEHRVEELSVVAGNVVAGTGFTIYGKSTAFGDAALCSGKWNIGWVWR